MKQLRRVITGLAAGLALLVSMGLSTAQAASGVTVYVDNHTGAPGSPTCPATPNTTIEDGLAAVGGATSNVTFNICPGTYGPTVPLSFNGIATLKIIGLGNPVITNLNHTADNIVRVTNSTNVTIQGLVLDGMTKAPSTPNGDVAAIFLSQVTGTVKGNTIINWRQPTITPIAGHWTAAIEDASPNPMTSQKLSITNNTIYRSGDFGIFVHDAGVVKVTNNRITFAPIQPAYSVPGNSIDMQAGIAFILTEDGGSVSGNKIFGSEFPGVTFGESRGIELLSTSKTKVTSNQVTGTSFGITVESYCDDSNWPNASGNGISGNTIADTTLYALYEVSNTSGFGGTTCQFGPGSHADSNILTGNKLYQSAVTDGGMIGIHLEAGGGSIAQSKISGNTIAGFNTPLLNNGASGTFSGNKVLNAPPGGF